MAPSAFFQCLSDDTRLISVLLIALEGELCVCELTEALTQAQPKVSRHLAILKEQQVLHDRRAGQWVFYNLHPALKPWQRELLASTASNNTAYLKSAQQKLSQMTSRPDRNNYCC